MKIGCSEVPKPSYPPYFDLLSERHQPLFSSPARYMKLLVMMNVIAAAKKFNDKIYN